MTIPAPPRLPLTLTLTVLLEDLPGVTAEQVQDAVGSVLDESYFTVTGEGDASVAATPHEMGRRASQLLSGEQAIRTYSEALDALSTALYEQSRALRIQGYEADADQAVAGWQEDSGHTKHGRLKPY
jgi:hypothetical protein